MNAADIVAYTYQADVFTPNNLIEHLVQAGIRSPGARGMSAEAVLDQWAGEEGIDRGDEHTFDSDAFPKVVFADQVSELDGWSPDEYDGWQDAPTD